MPISNGTIAVTNGSKNVTGTSTTFADSFVGTGDIMIIGGVSYFIESITSNTALVLTRTYEGTTATGKAYEISKISVSSFSSQLSDFFLKYAAIANAVSESSGAGKIPKAGSDGKIVTGYLPEIADATTAKSGLIQLATQAEANAGSDLLKAITAGVLAPYVASQRVIGSYVLYSGTDAPDHCLPCQGGTVSRTTYAALYALLGTTCGTGDGSTTFTLPDFRGKALWGAASGEVNTSKAAGLPNINGQIGWLVSTYSSTSAGTGALRWNIKSNVGMLSTSGTGHACDPYIDASLSNSIYGASSTVQPPAICVNVGIIYE